MKMIWLFERNNSNYYVYHPILDENTTFSRINVIFRYVLHKKDPFFSFYESKLSFNS